VTVTGEQALAEARTAEVVFRGGIHANPLLGIPVAYKDLYATQGVRTTAGSALLADWVPERNATCVTRLREAGSLVWSGRQVDTGRRPECCARYELAHVR